MCYLEYDCEFPPVPYEHYDWLLENLENYKLSRIFGDFNSKIEALYQKMENEQIELSPEFEKTFRKNFRKLLVKIKDDE